MSDTRPHLQDQNPLKTLNNSLTQQVYFETIGAAYGVSHNTFNLYLNGVQVLAAGVPQGGWALSAIPVILDKYGVDVSSEKTSWGSDAVVTHTARVKDLFDQDTGNLFETGYNEHLRRALWTRYRKTNDNAVSEVTHDNANDSMKLEIKSGSSETWCGMRLSGEGIQNREVLTNSGLGHSVRLVGDFILDLYFEIDNWSDSLPADEDTHVFYMKLVKTDDLYGEDQLHIEKYYEPGQLGVGFGSIIATPTLLSPSRFDFAGLVDGVDYAHFPQTFTNTLGFRVIRSGTTVTCEFAVDTDTGPTWTDITGSGAGNPYDDWTDEDLYLFIGQEIWGNATNMQTRVEFFDLSSGVTDKPRDVAWNLVPPSSLKSGALMLFDADMEDHDGTSIDKSTFWFYTLPAVPVLSDLFPVNGALDVSVNTNIGFDLESQDWGINMSTLNVFVRRYNNPAYPMGYDEEVVVKGIPNGGYEVNIVYSEMNRLIKDNFKQGDTIDTFTRWGTVEDVSKWTVNAGLTFNSNSEAIETSIISGSKGKITGDFDVILSGVISAMPSAAGDNFVALTIDNEINKVRVMRHASAGVHKWKMQRWTGTWVDQGTPVTTTDSDLEILGIRLVRIGTVIYAYYLVDTEWQDSSEWVLLGSWDSGVSGVTDIGIMCAAASAGDDLECVISAIEQISGGGTFSGKVSVAIDANIIFESDAVPTVSIDVYDWGNGYLFGEDGQFSFWCEETDTPHIKFYYPYNFPLAKVSISQGTDIKMPNIKSVYNMKRLETAAGFMIFNNVGYQEERLSLEVVFTSDAEATAFRDFFQNVIKGKSKLFHYRNYITGDERNVRLLTDVVSIENAMGNPYSFNLLLKVDSEVIETTLGLLWDVSAPT